MSNLDTTKRSSGYEPLVDGQGECLTPTEDNKKTGFDTREPVASQVSPSQSTVPTTPGFNARYKSLAGLATGILQIAIGMTILFVDILEVILNGLYHPLFWAPSFVAVIYIVAGILGVVSRKQRQCVILAYMVMSIISAICVAFEVSSCIKIVVNASGWCAEYDEDHPHHCGTRSTKITIATNATIAVFAFMEMVVALVASAFCCHGLCSCAGTPTQTALVMYDPANPDHQVVPRQVQGSYSPQNPNQQDAMPSNTQGPV